MQEAFIPVGIKVYNPEGKEAFAEERQLETLKAAGWTVQPPEVLEDPLSEVNPDKKEIADTSKAHSKAVAENIAAQQAAAAEKG